MEQAIKKAAEGGYDFKDSMHGCHGYVCSTDAPCRYDLPYCSYQAFLTPSFWQCLGKAVGWKEDDPLYDRFKRSSKINRTWLYHWHRFIDHLAEGKDAESFFNELLK